MRVQLPSKGCRGVDGPNGEIYRPARGHSYVDVPDGAFGRQAAQALGVAPHGTFHSATAEAVTCGGCGRDNWGWVKVCPRCGKKRK